MSFKPDLRSKPAPPKVHSASVHSLLKQYEILGVSVDLGKVEVVPPGADPFNKTAAEKLNDLLALAACEEFWKKRS